MERGPHEPDRLVLLFQFDLLSFDPLRPMSVQQTVKNATKNSPACLPRQTGQHARKTGTNCVATLETQRPCPDTMHSATQQVDTGDADKRALTKHRRHASRRHWRRRQACTDQTQAKLTNISKGAQQERHRSPQLAARRRHWGTMP